MRVQPEAKVFLGADKLQLRSISTVDLGRAEDDEVFSGQTAYIWSVTWCKEMSL